MCSVVAYALLAGIERHKQVHLPPACSSCWITGANSLRYTVSEGYEYGPGGCDEWLAGVVSPLQVVV